MKVFIRTYTDAGTENQKITEKESVSLAAAKLEKKAGEKIHLCYHDETPVKPCQLI